MGPKNILITGLPVCGKTTLVEKIVQRLNIRDPLEFGDPDYYKSLSE